MSQSSVAWGGSIRTKRNSTSATLTNRLISWKSLNFSSLSLCGKPSDAASPSKSFFIRSNDQSLGASQHQCFLPHSLLNAMYSIFDTLANSTSTCLFHELVDFILEKPKVIIEN